MKKHHIIISIIPILGSILYFAYICLKELLEGNYLKSKKVTKAGLSSMLGMICFMIIYGSFALIVNYIDLDLDKYLWIVITMFILSGITWNLLFFLVFNKATRTNES